MKKILLTLGVLLFCSATSCFGQEKGFQFGGWYQISKNAPFAKNNEFSSVDLVLAPGYSFNGRLFARVPITLATQLYDKASVKSYNNGVLMGATIGYDFFTGGKAGAFEIAGTFGGSITGDKPHYLYYDLGVMFGLGYKTKATLGIGVRRYESQVAGFKSYTTMLASFGFRFN